MSNKQAYRAVRCEFNGQTWDRMQKLAEHHDRYLKTFVSEIIKAEVDRLFDEMKADLSEDNTRDDDHFLSLDEGEVA